MRPTPIATPSPTLNARLDALCVEGWAIWERFDFEVRNRAFHPFIAADYDAVRRALRLHAGSGVRFLEWGSASGVITIMADLYGADAFGIELDDGLVATSRALAERHRSRARFVSGSFLPTGYRWPARSRDAEPPSLGFRPSGYLQLGRALDEFDVVFGYPWAGQAPLMFDLMKRYGRTGATLLLYDVDHGVRSYRDGAEV